MIKPILLFVVPLSELILLLLLSEYYGFLPVFFLLLALSSIGVLMLRRVGLSNTKRLLLSLQQGQELSLARMNAALKLFSALMFLFPGFLTSVIGALWFIPLVRTLSINRLVRQGMRFTSLGHIAVKPSDLLAANDE